MRVAILHDYLNQYGGAEKVLETLLEIFPKADIYTLFYENKSELSAFKDNIKQTSFLDFPLSRKKHKFFIPFFPTASDNLKILSGYDLIISDSAGYSKGFNTPKNVFHLSYIHTPLRYAWEFKNYFKSPLLKFLGSPLANYLKKWDLKSSKNPNKVLVPSNFIKEKVSNFYGIDSEILYPPVDWTHINSISKINKPENFYLAAGRLIGYKRFDLVIEAFKKLNLPLKIVGIGREIKNLKKLAGNSKNIEFLGFIPKESLYELYSKTKGFIFPQIEDFGLVAAEAQSAGAPIIGLNAGGLKEIIKENETGIFFNEQNPNSLIEAIKKFENIKFDRIKISQRAKMFDKEIFKNRISFIANNNLDNKV